MHTHSEKNAASDGRPQPLVYQKPLRTWASRGTGASCDLCSHSISPHEIEYQVELASDGVTRMLYMHFACHQRWASAGRKRGR